MLVLVRPKEEKGAIGRGEERGRGTGCGKEKRKDGKSGAGQMLSRGKK